MNCIIGKTADRAAANDFAARGLSPIHEGEIDDWEARHIDLVSTKIRVSAALGS